MKTYFVYFYTEGFEVDGVHTLDLRKAVETLRTNLTEVGYDGVFSYTYTQVKNMNPLAVEYVYVLGPYCGSAHGFYRWKSFIIDDVLKQIEEDDIVIYSDCNIFKFQNYLLGFKEYPKLARKLLEESDLFASNESMTMPLGHCCKRSAFEDFGFDYQKYKKIPLINARMVILRNTANMREFVREWKQYCLDPPELVRKDIYGIEEDMFCHHTEDQAIMNLVIRKKQIEGKISWNVGQICFPERRFVEDNLRMIEGTKIEGGFMIDQIVKPFHRYENNDMIVQTADNVYCLMVKNDGERPFRWIGRRFPEGDYVVSFEVMFEKEVPIPGKTSGMNIGWKTHYPKLTFYRDFLEELEVGKWGKVSIGFRGNNDFGIFILDGLHKRQNVYLRNFKIRYIHNGSLNYSHYLTHFHDICFIRPGYQLKYQDNGFQMDIQEKNNETCLKYFVSSKGTYEVSFLFRYLGKLPTKSEIWGFKTYHPERYINDWADGLEEDKTHLVSFKLEIPLMKETVGIAFENCGEGLTVQIRDMSMKHLH